MSLKSDFHKQKEKCVKCTSKDPCVTVYHGTSVNSVSSIRRDGMTDQYATTSAYRAHWFGKDSGRPILLKVRTPLSKLRWTDQDHEREIRVKYLYELKEEDDKRHGDMDDLFLFIKGKIKPCQIQILPRKELIKRVTKTYRKEKFLEDEWNL